MSNLFPTYARFGIEVENGEGAYLFASDGKKYLDFTSGIGVCNLGHKPPTVYEAIKEQLDKFWHVSNLFNVSSQEKAASMLAQVSGLHRVFFANSGAEANEGAIKLARKATGKSKIISFYQSFHGRTFATMAATGQEKIKQSFGPMLEKFIHLPFNDEAALKNEMDDDVAAIIVEAVQGEGGIFVADKNFMKLAEQLCKKTGALLIIDEVQTGIGRTGKPFAFQHFHIEPDVITLAKGLGSGLPIGAIVGKEKYANVFSPGSHGSTFGGNPIAIAAAIATMEQIFQPSFLEDVTNKGNYFQTLLTKYLSDNEIVTEIRGLGLMIGIELKTQSAPILADLREKGLLALPAGEKVIRLLPPLNVTKEQIERAVEKIASTLEEKVIKNKIFID